MIYLLRLAIAVAVVAFAFAFSGCERTHSDDDGQDHAAEHAHVEYNRDETVSHSEDEHNDEHKGHEDEAEGVIRLNQHELSEFGIRLAIAESGVLQDTVTLAGEIVLNPDRMAHVVARAPGIASEVFASIGKTVKPGEPLAVLESAMLAEAKADYLSRAQEYALARTDLNRAEVVYGNTEALLTFLNATPELDALREFADKDLGVNRNILVSTYAAFKTAGAVFEREKLLYDRKISSEAEYLEAESASKQATAAYLSVRDDLAFSNRRTLDERQRAAKVAEVVLKAADRHLHALGLSESEILHIAEEQDSELTRYVIEAPIGGVVIQRHIVRGELLEEGSEAFIIADLNTVWIELTVYPKDLAAIKPGQSTEIDAGHGIAGTTGVIDYVSPIIDDSSRTATARVVLPNPSGAWRPGLFVTAEVETDRYEAAIVVPRAAIQTINNEPVIFVEHHDDHPGDDGDVLEFKPQRVRLGRSDTNQVEILSGLHRGERYVAKGGFVLKAEMNKASFEHAGHAH